MRIQEASRYSHELFETVNRLLPQLSDSHRRVTESELEEIIRSPTTHLLLAYENETACGMLALVVFRIPSGVKAWIEDVVVGEADRGKGVGTLLVESAVKLARSKGAKAVDLTSRPARQAANRLYQKAGFEKRETNLYRFRLH